MKTDKTFKKARSFSSHRGSSREKRFGALKKALVCGARGLALGAPGGLKGVCHSNTDRLRVDWLGAEIAPLCVSLRHTP